METLKHNDWPFLTPLAKGRGSRLRDGNGACIAFAVEMSTAKGRGSRLRDGNMMLLRVSLPLPWLKAGVPGWGMETGCRHGFPPFFDTAKGRGSRLRDGNARPPCGKWGTSLG